MLSSLWGLTKETFFEGWHHIQWSETITTFFCCDSWSGLMLQCEAGLHCWDVLCSVAEPALWRVKLKPTALASTQEAGMLPWRLGCDVTQPFYGCSANFNVSTAGFYRWEKVVLINEAGIKFFKINHNIRMKQTDGQHMKEAYCFRHLSTDRQLLITSY